MKQIPVLEGIQYSRKENLAKTFMTKIFKKGATVVPKDSEANTFFILKWGTCRVSKKVVVSTENYWPTEKGETKDWEMRVFNKQYVKTLFMIEPM